MAALVLAEHNNAALDGATAKTVTAAVRVSGAVHVLVAGTNCKGAAEQAAKLSGVEKVFVVDDSRYANFLAEPVAALVVAQSPSYDALLAPATANGKNVMPRVAAMLDVPQISEIIGVESSDVFRRPIYAGNAIQTVEAKGFKKVITVRAAAFEAAASGGKAAIETLAAAADPGLSRFVGENLSRSERPDLTAARIVISGGRGLQSKENFALIERIADRLGAAVGASRAAVDAGFVPNDHQVGQTGKVVAPELYIAVGISGAIQHLAGMKDSKIIVAINKDEGAPIFSVADYGLVADLFEALPEFERALESQRGT
ncbi:MAG TPA: FAD-binding protein [Micropepsaceae bacterium]|jgi:electron transfer flavoprotein alpha subunit|nr:FAD-binding protein [Micropepsaceae bacterium]